MRDRPPHRELRPLLFSMSVWVLLRPTELIRKSCETGPTVYSPYPRRLESLTICRWQHFLLNYLKTPSVGPARVWTRDLPHASPVLYHWANRSAVGRLFYNVCLVTMRDSVSDQATKISVLGIARLTVSSSLNPNNWILFLRRAGLKPQNFTKNVWAHQRFCYPDILQCLKSIFSFNITLKEPNISPIFKVHKLFKCL